MTKAKPLNWAYDDEGWWFARSQIKGGHVWYVRVDGDGQFVLCGLLLKPACDAGEMSDDRLEPLLARIELVEQRLRESSHFSDGTPIELIPPVEYNN